jgi:uncharacterized protein YndB with AHSA1/START domain
MVVVEEEVDIRRPPEDVFDYCADLMHEPEWNPKMRHVETLTDGPVGVGARYEADLVPGDPMVIRYVRFDRPVRCTRTPCAVAHRISRDSAVPSASSSRGAGQGRGW